MLQISADLTALSQAQREALADFITSFPNMVTKDDPIRACPKVDVDPALFTPEEQAEEPLPVFDAPLPAELVLPTFDAPLPPGVGMQPHPAAAMIDNSKVVAAAANLDKNGLPWDDRIHASSKATTKDGAWRYKRGVESRLVDQVEGELRALMNLPAPVARVETTQLPPPPPTDPALSALLAASIPPPPAVPAAVVVPGITSSPVVSAPAVVAPPPPAVSGSPFVTLVNFAGAKNMEGKLSDAEIEAACKAVGVPALTLMTNRPDLCPHVEASLRQLVANR